MQSSIFNLRVPLPGRNEVFLMNTLTDAQLLVSSDVAALLDRVGGRATRRRDQLAGEERDAIELLRDNGFIVGDRARRSAARSTSFSPASRAMPRSCTSPLLTTLQCNFACDYCFQGDHGDYNKFAPTRCRSRRRSASPRGSNASSIACGRRSSC